MQNDSDEGKKQNDENSLARVLSLFHVHLLRGGSVPVHRGFYGLDAIRVARCNDVLALGVDESACEDC